MANGAQGASVWAKPVPAGTDRPRPGPAYSGPGPPSDSESLAARLRVGAVEPPSEAWAAARPRTAATCSDSDSMWGTSSCRAPAGVSFMLPVSLAVPVPVALAVATVARALRVMLPVMPPPLSARGLSAHWHKRDILVFTRNSETKSAGEEPGAPPTPSHLFSELLPSSKGEVRACQCTEGH